MNFGFFFVEVSELSKYILLYNAKRLSNVLYIKNLLVRPRRLQRGSSGGASEEDFGQNRFVKG